ncbi:MAG: hypothetical protein ACXVAX_05480 [Pseudobdellovibrio sp.]
MNLKNSVLLSVILVTGLQAAAVPTLYPNSYNVLLKNNTNSNVLADSQLSQKYYVLPPAQSAVKITGLNSVSANVGFCKEISEIQKYNLDTLQTLNSLKTKEGDLQSSLEQSQIQLKNAQIEMAKYVSANHLGDIANYDLQIRSLGVRLDGLYDKSRICATATDCGLITQDIQSSQDKLNGLWQARQQMAQQQSLNLDEYEKRKNVVETMEKSQEDAINNLQKVRTNLQQIYADFLSMYDVHSKREGAQVSLQYDSGWNQNFQRLQFDNPGYQFEKIATQNVHLRADAYGKQSLVPGGTLMAFDVAGAGNEDGFIDYNSYPENFSGTATLNLLGVCPILHPEDFGVANDDDLVNPQKMKFPLTIAYDYPSEFEYSLKVHYNLYKMYQITLNQGSQGGFLSSRTWTDKEEQTAFNDGFTSEWSSNSANVNLSDDDKARIEKDIRSGMLTRVAQALAMQNKNTDLVKPADTPKTGALVLSNALSQNCGLSLFCHGIGIGLDVLSSVFGSSQMDSSYRQQIDMDLTDSYTNKEVLMVPALTSFQ